MITIAELKTQINNCAALGADFLFGVDFELKNGFFVDKPMSQQDILWRVGSYSNFTPNKIAEKGSLISHPIPFSEYTQMFEIVHNALLHGDSFLTNLTTRTQIETPHTLEKIIHSCNSQYAILIRDKFVCFSPETFIKIENGIISSNPMKGTINANIPNAEALILADYKERAEHHTVVDLIRNDLSRVAINVKVDNLRYIDRLETSTTPILQVSSKISGELPQNYRYNLADIIFELLPAGSVSGAPKPSTIEIIRNAEKRDRGYYCGIFGYYDGTNLDTAVMIRFIEQQANKLYFRSGGGITINSNPQSEYNETIQKIYLPFK